MSKTIHFRGLNGVRAIAAIAVVIAHSTLSFESFGLDSHIFGTYDDGKPRTLDLAGYGVSMFFGLSGFLITFLLCREKEVTGKIDVRKFYARRILRIWPLYYIYIVVCFVIYYFFSIDYNSNSLFFYIFFTANIPFIAGTGLPFLGHYWSLGVEEQFYIFWPWLNRLKNRTLLYCLVIATLFLIVLKIVLHIYHPNSLLELTIHVTRFHCMMIGGITALLFYIGNSFFVRVMTNQIVQIIAWFVLVLVAVNKFHIASFLDNEFFTVFTMIIIIGQIKNCFPIRLENNFFNYLGRISYGIYVIHPLVIFLLASVRNDYFPDFRPYPFTVYFMVIFITILVAHISYLFLEKPFLMLKKNRFSVIKSADTM